MKDASTRQTLKAKILAVVDRRFEILALIFATSVFVGSVVHLFRALAPK